MQIQLWHGWRSQLFFCLFFLITLFLALDLDWSFAAEKIPEKDRQRLLTYLNTYDTDKFLHDPAVWLKLEIVAGQALGHVLKNIEVRGPIGMVSNTLFVSGHAQHEGLSQLGFVGIDLYNGFVYAAIYSEGRIHVYGKTADFRHLPPSVANWVFKTWACMALGGQMPPNTILHVQH